MIQWVHKVQELAASHPQVWLKINLTRGLIAAPWYNAVRDVLMDAGRALPRCPTREELMMSYKDKIVSDDTNDLCSEEDVIHRVAAQDDFLAAMKDALAVNDERTAWTQLGQLTQSIKFRCTGPKGVPAEKDCSKLAGQLGSFFDETGQATWSAWNPGEIAKQVIKIIGRGFPGRETEVCSALCAGKATGEEDKWRAVLERLGGIVSKIETAEEECMVFSQLKPAQQHQRGQPPTDLLVMSCSQQSEVRPDRQPGRQQNRGSGSPASRSSMRGMRWPEGGSSGGAGRHGPTDDGAMGRRGR